MFWVFRSSAEPHALLPPSLLTFAAGPVGLDSAFCRHGTASPPAFSTPNFGRSSFIGALVSRHFTWDVQSISLVALCRPSLTLSAQETGRHPIPSTFRVWLGVMFLLDRQPHILCGSFGFPPAYPFPQVFLSRTFAAVSSQTGSLGLLSMFASVPVCGWVHRSDRVSSASALSSGPFHSASTALTSLRIHIRWHPFAMITLRVRPLNTERALSPPLVHPLRDPVPSLPFGVRSPSPQTLRHLYLQSYSKSKPTTPIPSSSSRDYNELRPELLLCMKH